MAAAVTHAQVDLTTLNERRSKERTPEPTVVVIFGASGDLTKRKLLPALFHLEQAGLLPQEFAVVGVARRPLGDSFAKDMREGITEFGGVKEGDPKLDEFMRKVSYHQMDFDKSEGYGSLKQTLQQIDQEHGTKGNRLFYLAVAPEYFADIMKQLGDHKMAQPEQGTVHCIIEKPFGHDLESARKLNDDVNAVFREDQVFRIDHYLGKETVQNILVFRFGNGIFEPVWNRNYIDHVQITAAEEIGIEGRGPFYESAGALRDVIQNHVMELLSFVAMEPPISFGADALRREKIKVWKAIQPINVEDTVRGQYGPGKVNGRGEGLSAGGSRGSEVEHRDVRGAAVDDRELALGRRAVLYPGGQAAGEAVDGDRDPVQATTAVAFQGSVGQLQRHTAEHHQHAHPAG